MNVNNSSNANAVSVYQNQDVQEARQAGRAAAAGAGAAGAAQGSGANDDVHLSELVRSLRALAADSPERQAKIEQLARAAAGGNYQVDPQATADAIINDATSHAKGVSA
jgi:flagellar biosynthesis anti-sigma factor FlgM